MYTPEETLRPSKAPADQCYPQVIAFGLSFAICYATKYGLGRHQYTIPGPELLILARLEYTFSVLYVRRAALQSCLEGSLTSEGPIQNPALMLTKTSICIFYLSLSETRPVFKWSVWGTIVVVNAAGLALSFLNIFQCRPMSALFADPRPESAQCIDIITLYLSSAPVNIITDLVILLLPMPILKSMWMPRKQKIVLYVTFGFGIFVTAVDIVRIAYLQSATELRLQDVVASKNSREYSNAQQNTDFSWYASLSFMWTAIEVNVGIMVASVPHLKPLVTRFLPKMLRDSGEMTPQKRPSIVPTLTSGEMATAHRVPSATRQLPLRALQEPDVAEEEEVEEDGREMGFIDFLTTPDKAEMPRVERTQTALTNDTHLSRRGTNYLNFVDMSEQKSIIYMTNRESFRPVALVTCLFFIWGFAYGLLNTLNGQFQIIAHMSAGETIAQHGIYYAGYFVGPLTIGRLVLKKWGFKACYIVGLMIYGTGTLVFWPAAVLTSFVAFLISNFIVGIGLSTLEIGANPFMALCGPARYGEVRLNLSQGIQAIGTVVSPILAKKALFNNVVNAPSSLVDVQWTYLAISLFTFILAFVYYIVKLPEVTEDELEALAQSTHPNGTLESLRRSNTIWITLGLGVACQFLYVAAQEAVSTSLSPYMALLYPSGNVVNYQAIAHALFAFSRFLAAFAGLFLRPRHLLLFFFLGAIIFSALAMNFSGTTAVSMVLVIYFFEGPLFSLIFVAPLRGLGRHTKDGAALITAAISGGAVFVPIQHAVSMGSDYQYSYCVIVAGFAFATLFPLYVNLYPRARTQVDPPHGAAGDLSAGPDLPAFQSAGTGPAADQLRSSGSMSEETRHRGRTSSLWSMAARKIKGNVTEEEKSSNHS